MNQKINRHYSATARLCGRVSLLISLNTSHDYTDCLVTGREKTGKGEELPKLRGFFFPGDSVARG